MFFRTILLTSLAAASPALAQEVNIYSSRQPELIAPLLKAFTAETGIKTNVAFLKKGLIEKLKAEGDRTPADLILTVDFARLSAVVENGLTQPVKSQTLTANIPEIYRDPGDQWFGLTMRARVVYASRERVKPGAVKTYEDLADPKWKGRICIRSGLHPYNVALTAGMIFHHGETGAKSWLAGLKANLARKPQGNDRAQVKAVWAGECDIAIGNTYYLGKMLTNPDQKPWADAVNVAFPQFIGGGTHVNVSGMAMTRTAPHRDAALRLMEFLSSPEAQKIYASANFEYPVAPGIEPDPLVRSWGSFTPDNANLQDLAKLRPLALKITEEVDFDG